MAIQEPQVDRMILDLLDGERSITLEELVRRLPQLTWRQVFDCLNRLSHQGVVGLRRRGFAYDVVVEAPSAPSTAA